MKNIEGQFECTSLDGRPRWDAPEQIMGFMKQYDKEKFVVSFKQASSIKEIQRMINFLYGPILDCAVKAYSEAGYDGIDKVVAMYKLQAEFAKDFIRNTITGEQEPYLLNPGRMTKDRLLKFINDILFFLETTFFIQVPDSQKYKEMILEKRRNSY